MMRGNCLSDDLVVHGQQLQSMGFIRTHLTAKADNVSKHNRRQPPTPSLLCAVGSSFIGLDYSAGVVELSIILRFCWGVQTEGQSL